MPNIIDSMDDLITIDDPVTVEIDKYYITDFSVKSVNENLIDIFSDYLTLEFVVSEFDKKYHRETDYQLIESTSTDTSIKYTMNIWKTLLHRMYHAIFINGISESVLMQQDSQYYFQLWVGNDRVVAHFDRIKIDQINKKLTLMRWYDARNFLYNNGTTTLPDTFITVRLASLPLNMGKANMYFTYDNRFITYCNYDLKTNYSGTLPADLTYYVFDLDTSKNATAFDTMVADSSFYKLSISTQTVSMWSNEKNAMESYTVSIAYIYTKTPFSDDITVTLKETVDRIYRNTKTDITTEDGERNATVVNLLDSTFGVVPYTALDNTDILTSESMSCIFTDVYPNSSKVSSVLNSIISSVSQVGSTLKFYLSFLPKLDAGVNWVGTIQKYSRMEYTQHVDSVSQNFRIDSTTPYTFNPVLVRYTYNLTMDNIVDDTDSATYVSTNNYVKNNIVNVSISNNIATVVSKIQIGGTTTIPTSLIQITGTHTYTTEKALFEDFSYNTTIRHSDTFVVEDGIYCHIIDFDSENTEKYDVTPVAITTTDKSIYYETITEDILSDLATNIPVENLRWEDNLFKVDIPNYGYFLERFLISDFVITLNYKWRKTVITENYPFTQKEVITIFMDHDTNKQYSNVNVPDEYGLASYIDPSTGITYYVYQMVLPYEYSDLEVVDISDVSVDYVGVNGDDILFMKSTIVDPTYATIPTDGKGISLGYTTYGIPRYTNLDLKLYDMTTLAKRKDVYQTYEFSGTAYDKLLKITRVANIEAEEMANSANISYDV